MFGCLSRQCTCGLWTWRRHLTAYCHIVTCLSVHVNYSKNLVIVAGNKSDFSLVDGGQG